LVQFLIDGIIAIRAAIVFDLEKGLYAFMSLQKRLIITMKQDEVRDAFMLRLNAA